MISSWCNSNINIGTIDYSTDHQCKISHSQKCNYQRKGNKKQGNEKKLKKRIKKIYPYVLVVVCFWYVCFFYLYLSLFIDQNKVTYDSFFTRALTSYSCLHGDTKILLADYSEKNVSDLRVDDYILNRYLQPQKVIGINFSYLQERNMYQFGDDGPLFTADHQFYTVLDKSTTIVVSLKFLLGENPQLDGEDIQEIKNGDTVLKYDTLTQCIKENEIFLKEHKYYPPETKVYFVEVSGDGSYIAQNYIAKHELPDFRKFPFTNICFKKVLEIYKKLHEEKKFSISLEGSLQIKKHVNNIKALWQCITEFNINMEGKDVFVSIVQIVKKILMILSKNNYFQKAEPKMYAKKQSLRFKSHSTGKLSFALVFAQI